MRAVVISDKDFTLNFVDGKCQAVFLDLQGLILGNLLYPTKIDGFLACFRRPSRSES